MELATGFLKALAKQLSAVSLYQAGHPERERSLDSAYAKLCELLEIEASVRLSFLEGDVVFGDRPISELRQWEWALRLAEVGAERLEIDAGVTRSELENLLEEVNARLALGDRKPSRQAYGTETRTRFGPIAVVGEETDREDWTAEVPLNLQEELGVADWLHSEIAEVGQVPSAESTALVQLLTAVMHSGEDILLPLVKLKEADQYSATHSINVSVLSMGLAESLSLASSDIQAIGEAAVLHDVGKTLISLEILNKPGKLTDDERLLIEMHPVEGSKILLAEGRRYELSAIVALEHHIGWKGTDGYPAFHYPRQPHPLSRLVQVCDIYDALRTKRPYRDAWPVARTLEHLRSLAGELLDPEYVDAFLSMIQKWEPSMLDDKGEPISAAAVA
jgi:HD-GYP domain-containing protein (c-di-GMP phosphodiesterase class II)